MCLKRIAVDEAERYCQEQERQGKLLEQILRQLQEGNSSALTLESDWLDDLKLAKLLNISPSTIARRRNDGTFKYFRVGGRYYYLLKDILKLKDRFMK